jgi:hypothetical protein
MNSRFTGPATNPRIEHGDPTLLFIELWYYQAITATIRRHLKDEKQSHSLIRLLRQIAERPAELSLTPAEVLRDIEAIQAATVELEEYADRTVAHLDKRGLGNRPRVADVRSAVGIISKVFGKYQKLLLGLEPPIPDVMLADHWTNVLDIPWRHREGAA